MKLPGRPRETPRNEPTKLVSTRFADSFVAMIDRHIPDHGRDRSEVLRQALLTADRQWTRARVDTMSFPDLLALSRQDATADIVDPAQRRYVRARVTVDVRDNDIADFTETIELLANSPRSDVTARIHSPGTVDFFGHTDTPRHTADEDVVAHHLMHVLELLPDANPWRLPMARQVMSPRHWWASDHDEYQFHTTETLLERSLPVSTTETRLRTLADNLIEAGVMFVWGGGNADGPTTGIVTYAPEIGFDAGSLAMYVYKQLFGITLPRTTSAQYDFGTPAPAPQPGDLVFPVGQMRNSASIYLGDGQTLAASTSGAPISIEPIFKWGTIDVIRIIPPTAD